MGKPLYGDVFGTLTDDQSGLHDDENIEKTPWGELESESESEEESEESAVEDEDQTGLVTPGDAYAICFFINSLLISYFLSLNQECEY